MPHVVVGDRSQRVRRLLHEAGPVHVSVHTRASALPAIRSATDARAWSTRSQLQLLYVEAESTTRH